MAKMSQKKKAEILEKKFPEFYKLSKEMDEAIQSIIYELQEKLDKLEEIEELQDELNERKTQLEL